MAKTAAQRAARSRRRKAKASANANRVGMGRPKQRSKRKNPVQNRLGMAKIRKVRPPLGGTTVRGATNKRQMVVTEDEYIADVAPSVNFANTQYSINPGNSTTFPWLSSLAQNFNKYKFLLLEFYYKRTVSEFATDGQTGKIILSINPDASDPAPSSKQQAEDYQMKMDGMPCENFGVKGLLGEFNKQDSYYIRVGAQPANTDIKTYDVGNLNVSSQGTVSASGVCGELRVRYTVMLHSPILTGSNQFAIFNSGDFFNSNGDGTAADPFGAAPTWIQNSTGSTLDIYVATPPTQSQSSTAIYIPGGSNKYLTLPNLTGTWLVTLYWSGTGIAAVPTVTASGGAAITGATGASGYFLVGGTSAVYSSVIVSTANVAYSNTVNRLTIGGLTSMTAASTYVVISQVNVGFTAPTPDLDELQENFKSLVAERDAMEARLIRLEGLLSPPVLESPEECKGSEQLEQSVHLDRRSVRKLLGLV